METKPKNRAWVKDAAIVFLVVLLLLTFFSNTIMNHSLPEVATVMVSNGTITAKVRGTGTVSANGDHKVKAKSGFTIGKVMVKAGQEVNAGDVLFVLGAGDSDELEEAKIALEDLQVQYSQAALSVPLADSFIDERNEVNKAYKAWEDAKAAYDKADAESKKIGESKAVKSLLEQKKDLESQITSLEQRIAAEKQVLTSTQTVLNQAIKEYDSALKQWQREQQGMSEPKDDVTDSGTGGTGGTGSSGDGTGAGTGTGDTDGKGDASGAGGGLKSASGTDGTDESKTVSETDTSPQSLGDGELTGNVLFRPFALVGAPMGIIKPDYVLEAEAKVDNLQTQYNNLENEYVEGVTRLVFITNKQYEVDALELKLKSIESQLSSISGDAVNLLAKEQAVDDAWAVYEAKNASLLLLSAQQERSIASASVGLTSISNQIKRQQDKIKKLSGEGDENTVTANVSGTITEVNCTAGDTVVKDDILASIEVPDQGYTVSVSVTNDQAKRLRIGDTATISNYYWGNKIVATLSGIQTYKKNPMTNKTLTFDLEGDVTSGSEITVSVGQKSANYDIIIPNSAIRTDSNGNFVLAVTAKNSPLGNRYIAKRVAIEVLAADDNNSAVTADLSNGDYVITTSSAPIATGDMVRLANEEN